MKELRNLLLLALVCALALQARVRAGSELAGAGAPDAESAAHLRAIGLCLAHGGPPARDGFLPAGEHPPDLPFGDAILATLARGRAASPGGDPALAGVDEPRLEAVLRNTGPWLAVATAIGLFFAVHGAARGPWRASFALLAAALFALSPSAVRAGAAGRIDLGALHALLLAWTLAASAQLALARQTVDGLSSALPAGIVAGLAWLVGRPSLAYVPSLWIVALAGGRASTAAAVALRQAGALLAAISGAIVLGAARLGGFGSAAWLSGIASLSLGMAALLLLAALGGKLGARWRIGAGAVVIGWLLVASAGTLARPLRALWVGRGDLASAAELARDPLPWIALLCLAVAASRRRLRAEPVAYAWAWALAGSLGLAVLRPELAALAAAAAAAFVAWTLDRVATERAPADAARAPRPLVPAVLGLGAVLLLALRTRAAAPLAVAPEERTLVEALRWMREGTPASEPWHAAGSRPAGSVLAPWTLGHALAYHARRAPLASGWGAEVDEQGARAAMALFLETDGERLATGLARRGARYVLAGAVALREWGAVERLARRAVAPEETAVWRLSTLLPDDAPEARFFALERAWGTSEVAVAGDTFTVPTVVLYRLEPPAIARDVRPELRAPREKR